MRVLVLGGAGFLGRHVVAALEARGHTAIIGSRRSGPRGLPFGVKPRREWREARFERLTAPDAWAPLLGDVDAVVNCVGVLFERGRATYERVHLVAPAALAAACAHAGLRRLVHVSALGMRRDSSNRFIRSKLRGEKALRLSGVPCTIVRPSLIEGPGGYGSRWIRRVARWPVQPMPENANGRFAVIDVRDVADAIAVLCTQPPPRSVQTIELGGRSAFTLHEYMDMLRQLGGRRRARPLVIPAHVARFIARACDLLHISPFGMATLTLLGADNVPVFNALPRLLVRAPHGIGSALVISSGWAQTREAVSPIGHFEA
jgi:NADH dehydrogenase